MIGAMLKLCRLYYAIPMSLAYLLTVYYARGGEMAGQWGEAFASTAALAMVIAGAYALNDVVDRSVDRINSPDRPVAAGRVAPAGAGAVAAALTIGGLGMACFCRPAFLATVTAVACVLLFYNLLQSNVTNAHRLKGKLFLIVGELDRNVDPSSTMQVVNALIKANKDFDLLVIPGGGHGVGGSYGSRRRMDFFVRHLLGVEPRSKP